MDIFLESNFLEMSINLLSFLKICFNWWKLFYHFVLVSAIQPCKLAIIIYIYHLLLEPLSPSRIALVLEWKSYKEPYM